VLLVSTVLGWLSEKDKHKQAGTKSWSSTRAALPCSLALTRALG